MRQPFAALLSSCVLSLSSLLSAASDQPSIVIIFMDDMGYADVSCFGAQGYQTPNIDRLAAEGRKFTNFHVAQPVCSASRTALLTGCYPNRLGIHGALGPNAKHGISSNEMTLAELVKQKGYATAAVGKWHLGSLPQFLPTKHGFDQYYGIPYSNDMWPFHPQAKKGAYPDLPMYENDHVVDANVTPEDQTHLTTDYTTHGVQFIEKHKDKPFLLYLAHSMVHVPLFVSDKYQGKSGKGLFADVMMEVDWSVGQIMDTLKKNGLEENTWVIFTSDNGPWLSYGDHAGSAGPLREGKGTCWEGGTRVTGIMKWPGKIPAGTTTDTMMMTIDLLPTIAHVLEAKLPDHPIDGLNCWPIVSGVPDAKNPHDFYAFYYEQNQLQAITSGDGRWKLQLPHTYRSLPPNAPKATGGKPVNYVPVKIEQPELYDLYTDLSESKNLAAQNPEEVARLQKHADTIRAELGDTLMKRPKGTGTREAGK
jgi:arylsulfatase A